MITSIKTNRLVVISDLHLGNPFSSNHKKVVAFLKWAAEQDFDLCINGDGFEIAQASFSKLVSEIPEVIRALKDLRSKGKKIYYVVGNHDIAFEHFLEDWGALTVSPFLNVSSGSKRIRIEHGHLYDPFFISYPQLYEFLTRLGGVFLKISPSLYKAWIHFEKWRAKVRSKRTGIVGEKNEFREAASEIAKRGFDAVVLGHTHHRGLVNLEKGAIYLNPGSWLISTHYVEITNGNVRLAEFSAN